MQFLRGVRAFYLVQLSSVGVYWVTDSVKHNTGFRVSASLLIVTGVVSELHFFGKIMLSSSDEVKGPEDNHYPLTCQVRRF